MDKLLEITGHIGAGLGILVCLLAGVSRLAGYYYFLGFETITLFIGGIALMVMACLARLYRLEVQGKSA